MEIYDCILFLTVFSGAAARNSFSGCLEETTYGYGYLQYFPVDALPKERPDGGGPNDPNATFYLEFYVRIAQNAHIFICEKDQDKNGFEILLGGGSNTFSQIRRLKDGRRSLMTTAKIADTVSDKEDRGFWIELDGFNNLIVGKMGLSEPFLYYYSPSQIPIRFFSFGSWANIKGVWHFACPKNPPPDEDGEKRNATTTERLRNDLFTYYNPNHFPEHDGNQTQTVEAHLEAFGLCFDEARGQFEISGIASLKWNDWKLIWNSEDYDGIDSVHVKPEFLWTPQIKVLNSATFERTSFLNERGSVHVKNNGEVNWRSPFRSVTFCLVGYKKWPYDRHNCTVSIGFLPTEPLQLSIETVILSTSLMSQWEIQNQDENGAVSYVDTKRGTVQFHFQRRNPSEIVRNFIVPPFLSAATLTLLSFWTNPNGIRFFFCCGSVLILVMTLVILGDTLPMVLSTGTDGFYHLCVFFYVFPVLFFVGVKYLSDSVNLPQFAAKFLNSKISGILFCFPQAQVTPSKFRTREEMERSKHAFLIGILYERLFFSVYLVGFIISFIITLVFPEAVL